MTAIIIKPVTTLHFLMDSKCKAFPSDVTSVKTICQYGITFDTFKDKLQNLKRIFEILFYINIYRYYIFKFENK